MSKSLTGDKKKILIWYIIKNNLKKLAKIQNIVNLHL